MVVNFCHLYQHFSSYPQLCFCHEPKINSVIMIFHSHNRSVIRTHGFFVSYSQNHCIPFVEILNYPEKVPVMTNITLTPIPSFINTFALRHINPIILQHL